MIDLHVVASCSDFKNDRTESFSLKGKAHNAGGTQSHIKALFTKDDNDRYKVQIYCDDKLLNLMFKEENDIFI